MKKPLAIGLFAAALIAGVLSLVKVDGVRQPPASVVTQAAAAESEPAPVVLRMAQLVLSQPLFDYERGPRIIHVPQNDRVASHRPEPAATLDDDDDVVISPPPRPRVAPVKPRVVVTPPPPPGPRRAMLTAPPMTAGPTPLRPTPRFDSKAADRGEKFAAPSAPVARAPVVSESQPPLGYSPPVMPESTNTEESPAAALPAD